MGKPSMIIAHTVKGKGVSFMENNLAWHYKSPNNDELLVALSELEEKPSKENEPDITSTEKEAE